MNCVIKMTVLFHSTWLTAIMLWILQINGELCRQNDSINSTWLKLIMLWELHLHGELCHQNDSIIQLNMVESN